MAADPPDTGAVRRRAPPSLTVRLALAAAVALAAVALYRVLELDRLLTLQQLQASRDALVAAWAQRPAATLAAFFGVYLAVASLSIPGAVVLTLAAGAIFGLGVGVLVVSFASSLGALVSFLAARHLLREVVQARLGRYLTALNEGMRQDGAFYLLTLRLVPLFPFGLVNLLMGLVPIGAARFYAVSQLGMLPGTVVFVYAGTQLGALRTLQDVLSPGLLGSFVLLGLFPLLARAAVGVLRRRRLYARWPRPRRFDRNLVVIGGGAGGLVAAYVAAAAQARVSLVEARRLGGDCLNTGCVPSKALIRSARLARELREAPALGFSGVAGTADFAAIMQRVQAVIGRIEPHDSAERYESLGVEVLQGHARLRSPWCVEVTRADGSVQALSTRSIVIATGASPLVPALPGLQEAGFLTSDTVWSLRERPARLLVLGGGPAGCELAQAFARLGSQVTLVEAAPRLLAREEPQAGALVAASLAEDGVRVLTGHEALRVETGPAVSDSGTDAMAPGRKHLVARHEGREVALPFDELLCVAGRRPRVTGYGLEELGLELTPRGGIRTDAFLRTRLPNIYAVGDVASPLPLTHSAGHEAWHAAVNALFGRWRRFRVDHACVPRVTFTDPEVARVGLTQTEALEQGVDVEVTRYELAELDRALIDGCTRGFVQVLTVPGRDRILGVTIVGEQAGELIAPYVLAMQHGLGLARILSTVHAYPTLAESGRQLAGQWRRAHAPRALLRLLQRYHAWERR